MLEDVRRRLKADGEIILQIRARPGASESRFTGVLPDGSFKADIAAPAEGNRANDALIRLVAEALEVPATQVTLLSGGSSRRKRMRVRR